MVAAHLQKREEKKEVKREKWGGRRGVGERE